MPTREIVDCLERLRSFIECMEAVLDTGHLNVSAAAFLTTEIKRAINDLSNSACQQEAHGEPAGS